MKKLKIFLLGLLVICIFAIASLTQVRTDGRFILPVGYCKLCLTQLDRT